MLIFSQIGISYMILVLQIAKKDGFFQRVFEFNLLSRSKEVLVECIDVNNTINEKITLVCNSVRSVPRNQYVVHWMEINHGTWISPILNGNACGDIYYYSNTGVTVF